MKVTDKQEKSAGSRRGHSRGDQSFGIGEFPVEALLVDRMSHSCDAGSKSVKSIHSPTVTFQSGCMVTNQKWNSHHHTCGVKCTYGNLSPIFVPNPAGSNGIDGTKTITVNVILDIQLDRYSFA